MITAEAIIEILSERGEFANFCNKCEWAIEFERIIK